MTYFSEDQSGMPMKDKILVRFCICSVGIMGGGAHRFGTVVSEEVGAAEAGRNIFLMSSYSRTIHELDAEDEENFNVSEDSENCDATETPVDTGMEAEVEELEEESPNERHGEQNGSAEHVMLSRAQILEMEFANPDEACRFHEQYSRAKGFAMRQGKKMKNRKGEIDEMRIKRKANSTSWYVCRFVDKHNHDLLPAKFVSYLPAYRKISDVDRAHMDSLRQVGISIPKIYESIAA
ncbi:protein FAR1-RELATED SEQUENCE 11-like [Arachis ipaensis]|uniref:protein FAR1-RELATED SEQUENCE 11-like n=1 Tax=Arachis ipaensis TaxID=130454 RepID=UPI000A2B3472|nr:protein FAR1-RELATED SEQUENCE 11-like [Arachis ipaensis]